MLDSKNQTALDHFCIRLIEKLAFYEKAYKFSSHYVDTLKEEIEFLKEKKPREYKDMKTFLAKKHELEGNEAKKIADLKKEYYELKNDVLC